MIRTLAAPLPGARCMLRRRWLKPIFCLLLVVSGAIARAQSAPTFLIDRVVVEGLRKPSTEAIVVSEAALRPGESYDENALRQAVYRVKRLPFVLDAEMALRKGAAREHYELVITVHETTALFLDGLVEASWQGGALADTGEGSAQFMHSGTIGAREFVGAQGLAFATLSSDHDLQAGYTQYHLFGPGSYASASVTSHLDGGLHSHLLSVSAGKALPLNQSLTLTLSEGDAPSERRSSALFDWIFDTRDDPLFPTRGSRVDARFGYESTSTRSAEIYPGGPVFPATRSLSKGIALTAAHYFPLTGRQSWGLGASVDYATQSEHPTGQPQLATGFSGTFSLLFASHQFDLWGAERARRFGDLKLETLLQTNPKFLQSSSEQLGSAVALTVSVVHRRPWGIVRLALTYSDTYGVKGGA